MPLPKYLEKLARDCEITPYRSSGPGGQKKNKTESSVRIRHLPTGLVRVGTESRSQTRNREAALRRIWAALEQRARKPKPRKKTRPSAAAVARRLEQKKRLSQKKRDRGRQVDD